MKNEAFKYQAGVLLLRLLYIIVIVAYLVLMGWLLSGCERREMYVYGDEYQSVVMDVNWRKYADTDPDGMTVWFYPLGNNPLARPYRTTTANVRTPSLYLPGGVYQGMVIDYSPEEYSHQQFKDLDDIFNARVETTPINYQPDTQTKTDDGGVDQAKNDSINTAIYGEAAWTDKYNSRPPMQDNGLYTVANQPEDMALDTLSYVVVGKGEYGDYIPWTERDTYQDKITLLTIPAEPKSIVWKVRIRVYIADGFNYIWQIPASITGLSSGHYLATDKNTDTPCIMTIDGWEMERTGPNSGYIQATLYTFGLCPGTVNGGIEHKVAVKANTRAGETEPEGNSSGWFDYFTDLCDSDALRLNLAFTLRDHATTIYYHFDVGQCVVAYDEQLVLRIDLEPSYFDPDNPDGGGADVKPIDLPYVEALNGTGFDANVTEWEEGGTADTTL